MSSWLCSGSVPFSRSKVRVPYDAKLGTICAFCYKERGDTVKLSCCGRCKRLKYCSRSCQKAQWPMHRTLCKRLVEANQVIKEHLERDPDACASLEYESQISSLSTIESAERKKRAEVIRFVQHGIHCSVCYKTPIGMKDEKWRTCSKCHYGWCCHDHWDLYEPKHSREICETFQKLHGIAQFTLNHLVEHDEFFGELPLDENGSGYFNPTIPTNFFDSWTEYFQARFRPRGQYHQLQMAYPWFFDSATGRLSQVCTVLYGMEQFGMMESFHRKSKLCVHVVGAAGYELNRLDAWEEMVHYLPQLRQLTVHFIGPSWPTSEVQRTVDNCPTCVGSGNKLIFCFSRMTYHECRDSDDKWQHPDLLIASNTGLTEECTESWKTSLQEIIHLNIRSIFTSYTEGEATGENRVFTQLGANLLDQLDGVINPFHDQQPHLEQTGIDEFYYCNYYITCFQGSS